MSSARIKYRIISAACTENGGKPYRKYGLTIKMKLLIKSA